MMTRRSLEGALKCALRDLLREEARAVGENYQHNHPQHEHIQPQLYPRNHNHHHHNSTISLFHHM